jgi:hypothetical protein
MDEALLYEREKLAGFVMDKLRNEHTPDSDILALEEWLDNAGTLQCCPCYGEHSCCELAACAPAGACTAPKIVQEEYNNAKQHQTEQLFDTIPYIISPNISFDEVEAVFYEEE